MTSEEQAALREVALAEARVQENKAAVLWARLQDLKDEMAPLVERHDSLRSEWCAAHERAQQLRSLFPDTPALAATAEMNQLHDRLAGKEVEK